MDWSRFGLSRDPFERDSELDDACLPNALASLLSELQTGLRTPQSVSVVIGESGCGKSLAAAALVRRLAPLARVAFLATPASSASAIARDALTAFDGSGEAFALDDDWTEALRADVERNGAAGVASVVILDDAHRLSPQALGDLAGFFSEHDALAIHLFLFGRPRLQEGLRAGGEQALGDHLLQVLSLEPLEAREAVRYLERRIALAGARLPSLFTDDAVESAVRLSGGRLAHLETVAAQGLWRALKRKGGRARAEDVMAIAGFAMAEDEEAVEAGQEPLRFDAADEEATMRDEEWTDEEVAGEAVDEDESWAEDDDEDEDEWLAGDDVDDELIEEEEDEDEAEELEQEEDLCWETAPAADDLEDEEPPPVAASRKAVAAAAPRRRLAGPAVLSLGACLALVWAANHVPRRGEDAPRGRDTKMFADSIDAEPGEILRLAGSVEAADADSHVVAWNALPAEEREWASRRAALIASRKNGSEPAGEPGPTPAVASAGGGAQAPDSRVASVPTAAVAPAVARAEQPKAAATVVAKAEAKPPRAATTGVASTKGKAPAASVGSQAQRKSSPVYTVQLGAFRTRRNAEDMATRLRGKQARILQEGGLYRVLSGAFPSKKDAVVHEAALKKAGYTTFVRTATF